MADDAGANRAPQPPSPVDLLFDARHIRQSGIGTYIRTLLPHLESKLDRRGLSLAVLTDPQTQLQLRDSTAMVFSDPGDASMYGLAEQKAWRHGLNSVRPQAIWVPHYPFPLALLEPKNRSVLAFSTVHDTLHLQQQSLSDQSRARQMYARTMLNLDGRKCRRIFTPSQVTATSLVEAVPSAKVMVTPIPVEDVWFTPVDPGLSPVRSRYILYVGNAKRHKNLPLLLNVYAEIAAEIPQDLVIAGGGQTLRTQDERVGSLAAQDTDRIKILGRLDFEALRSLVAGADLLIMPSLWEGAGLPPLEAMASGTAVLSSSIPVLRETCGDGADYFDPYDQRELAALLRTYCRDDDARAGLAARGRSHVTLRQSQISFGDAVEAVCDELDRGTA